MGEIAEPASRPSGRRRRWIVAALVACVPVIVGLAAFLSRSAPAPIDEDDETIEGTLVVHNPGYVGIAVCAECHAERAAMVQKTRHALACREASVGVAAPGFAPGRGRSETGVPGIHFEMTRNGNDFDVSGVRTGGEVPERKNYRIGLVYGSGGKRDEMYFAWEENRLFHLPVAWLYPLDQWGHAVNTIHGRATPPSCLECHNTWVGHVPGTANQYQRDGMILGVTCERCHGPGKEHVDHHRNAPNDPAHAIVHPGTLSRERLMDVCGQCHGNTRPLGPVFSYRPGEPLDAHFRTVRTKHPEEETTNQVRYLTESKCFQKSEMTCITCHDPHRTKSAANGCAQCHKAADCREQPRLPAEVRPDCVGCHMPSRIWMHVHFYTTRDDQYLPIAPRAEHRIGIYPEATNAVKLAWHRKQPGDASRAEAERLAALVSGHWLAQADLRLGEHRYKAAIGAFRESLKIASDPLALRRMQVAIGRQSELDGLIQSVGEGADRKPEETIDRLGRILALKPDEAFAHGQLGTIYLATGRRADAVKHLQEVVKYDPNDSYGVSMLASMALQDGRAEDAAAFCAEAHRIDAGHPGNHFVWGQAHFRLKRWSEAEEQFRKTLAGSPAHVGANQGLSEALRERGQANEAVRYARRAAHWSGSSRVDVLLSLADAYLDAGRPDDARNTLNQALRLAESTNSGQAPDIRERLRKL